MTTMQFPSTNDPFFPDIPVWMNFYAANYSTFSRNRTRNYIISHNYLQISIPYPQDHTTMNNQFYGKAGSKNNRVIEKGFAGVGQMINAQFNKFIETSNSFLNGGNILQFDHYETQLEPGARRTHKFNILMIAKNREQAKQINDIALAFQTNVFPISNTTSILTMRHPPLWCFKALVIGNSDFQTNSYWDGQPLVSVLASADINRSPILNTAFITSDFKPIAVNIKLSFIELEPALQVGDGSLRIWSRSERLDAS